MPITLHDSPDRTQASDLRGLFGEIARVDKQAGGVAHDFYPIEMPNEGHPIKRSARLVLMDNAGGSKPVEGFGPVEKTDTVTPEILRAVRAKIRERIIQLFFQSMINIADPDDKKSIVRSYVPVPGAPSRYIDHEDLSVASEDIHRLVELPDLNFNTAFANRTLGALRILVYILNFTIAHGDARASLKFLQKISTDFRTKGGEFIPLVDIPWEKEDEGEEPKVLDPRLGGKYRKDILTDRLAEFELMDYSLKNGRHLKSLTERFPGNSAILKGVVDSFNSATFRLQVSDANRAQWLNILVSSLDGLMKKLTPEIEKVLRDLASAIALSTTPSQISGAIDFFVSQANQYFGPPMPVPAAAPPPTSSPDQQPPSA